VPDALIIAPASALSPILAIGVPPQKTLLEPASTLELCGMHELPDFIVCGAIRVPNKAALEPLMNTFGDEPPVAINAVASQRCPVAIESTPALATPGIYNYFLDVWA
jgi:hypothetical protein